MAPGANQAAKSRTCQGAIMINSFEFAFALLVPNLLLVPPDHAGGDRDKNPEDVFKGFAAAMKKDDVKAVMSYVTRDSQTGIAGLMWISAFGDKSFTGAIINNKREITPKEKEHIDAIDEVLKHHGLSDDAMEKILEKERKEPTKDENNIRMLVALGEPVKDKAAFVREVLKVTTGRIDSDYGVKEIGETKVKEVKVDGKQAKSQVTFPGPDGKEGTGTIYFKLESEVWKIDLVETVRQWPPPPPEGPKAQPPATHDNSRQWLLRPLCPCRRRW
jgi:hypothetical protein